MQKFVLLAKTQYHIVSSSHIVSAISSRRQLEIATTNDGLVNTQIIDSLSLTTKATVTESHTPQA